MAVENQTIKIESFQEVPADEYPKIPLIVIYKHPLDFPGMYVGRLWNIGKPTPYAIIAKTLQEVKKVIPKGMIGIPRSPEDDPNIVATYI